MELFTVLSCTSQFGMDTEQTKSFSSNKNSASGRKRSLFVPGFVVGFLLMTGLSCAGGLYAAGVDASSITELRAGSAVWTPPPGVVRAPAAESTAVGAAATSYATYVPGDRPQNVTASLVNLRNTPGYLGKPVDDVIAQATPGQEVEILDGPQSKDGLVWWYVRLAAGGAVHQGWIAEATGSGVQILGE